MEAFLGKQNGLSKRKTDPKEGFSVLGFKLRAHAGIL
jgi:hypothetical protein